jgi:aldose 1-epimerase
MLSPSGHQYEIRYEDQRATVVEVGGGLRTYENSRGPILDGYAPDAICDGGRGALLIPWPNRLGDGRYLFDGTVQQLALSEPERHNAIHGLVRWRNWEARSHTETRVVMAHRLYPQAGYPFLLDLEAAYSLGPEGLLVTLQATNKGSGPCPLALGQHPYLWAGGGLVDDASLVVPAGTRVAVDPVRQLPTGREPVEHTAYDFRQRRRVGPLAIDCAYTDLVRDGQGRAWVTFETAGRELRLWVDAGFPFIGIYTGDTLVPPRRRQGLAVEPMTAPADAFRTGDSLAILDPGQSLTASWGITVGVAG